MTKLAVKLFQVALCAIQIKSAPSATIPYTLQVCSKIRRELLTQPAQLTYVLIAQFNVQITVLFALTSRRVRSDVRRAIQATTLKKGRHARKSVGKQA